MALLILPFPAVCFWLARKRGCGRRESLLLAMGAAGAGVTGITEALSVAGAVGLGGVAAGWILLTCLAVWAGRSFAGTGREGQETVADWDWASVSMTGAGLGILGLVGVTAYFASPSTWDAMTYHMVRVVRWAMQGSVSFYATNDPQQLFQPPLAEYFLLHLYVLAGGDQFANLVQAVAFGGCAVGASLVAGELGATRIGQAFAGLAVLSLPQGILQASGAKNDCVLGLWLIGLCYALVKYLRAGAGLWLAATAAFAGLAVLTKGTSYVYVPGVVVAALGMEWGAIRRRRVIGVMVLIAGVGVMNAGHYARTAALYGSPLGSGYADTAKRYAFRNETIGPLTMWGNLWRNVALHGAALSPGWNRAVDGVFRELIEMIGEDPQNAGALWHGTRFGLPAFGWREDLAGNPLQMGLAGLSLLYAAWRRKRLGPQLAWFAVGTAVAFLLFCLVLRWQPWHMRLHFGWFVLAAPLMAAVLERMGGRMLTVSAAGLMVLWAAPVAVGNPARPLWGSGSVIVTPRQVTVFADGPGYMESYRAIAETILASRCRDVELDAARHPYVYPLLALLEPMRNGMRIRETNVQGEAAGLRVGGGRGCAVVCLHCAEARQETDELYGSGEWRGDLYGEAVLYTGPGMGTKARECAVRFERGWYGREGGLTEWWQWTAKKGTVEIDAARAGGLTISGQLYTAADPNRVRILWNGNAAAELEARGTVALGFSVEAGAGRNILEFESGNEGELRPPDTRRLAMQVRNLEVRRADGTLCEVP